MYLINTMTLKLEQFIANPPPYAILSHTWGNDEVSFAEFKNTLKRKLRLGYKKIALTCQEALQDGIGYAWVDTCCINKDSSAELSEAINSMFRWYQNAELCYAFLEDLDAKDPALLRSDPSLSRDCKWLSRGWTLQELLAPRDVVFYAPTWTKVAGMPSMEWTKIGTRGTLIRSLTELTGIPADVLKQTTPLSKVSVADRMSWASRRKTTRPEDEAYCLLGIFNVNMPLLYGEGDKAFIRLQEEIARSIPDDSLFAWKASQQLADEYPYRGLFASSPSEFTSDESITPFQLRPDDGANVLGNGWVSLSCAIFPGAGKRSLLGLKCFKGGDVSKILCIEASAIRDGVFSRTSPDRLKLCPHGEFQTITIEKFAMRKDVHFFDDIYRRDGVYLEQLPPEVSLVRVHIVDRPPLQSSAPITVPIIDLVGSRVGFQLHVTDHRLGQDVNSGVDVLVIVWVDRTPEARKYRYTLRAQKILKTDGALKFKSSEKPAVVRGGMGVWLERSVIKVTGTYKVVDGHWVFNVAVMNTPQPEPTPDPV